jgi:hypothetical protein
LDLQFTLNLACRVGRLDLPEPGLTRYVQHLISAWDRAGCRREQPVVWSTDSGAGDITTLMHTAIATPIARKLGADPEVQRGHLTYLESGDATWDKLGCALARQKPALVVTTSHGMTGPISDPTAMVLTLGIPVDASGKTRPPQELLGAWQPDGAIWYAHACCSAGSDRVNHYRSLVNAESSLGRTLEAVRGLGARVAPLPTALLGAEKPLRAFVGHVEPTFNWTLRQPETEAHLTENLCKAICNGIFGEQPEPVSLALGRCYRLVGTWLSQWRQAQVAIDKDADARRVALRTQLAALDQQGLVVLGDPTACLPAPPE